MNLTATHINYFYICKRKLWLFSNGIHLEHTSDTVAEGRLLHETSYPQRAERYTEIELSCQSDNNTTLLGKIDFYDAKNKIIHEIKKSDKMEEAHEWQVKFYIWLLELNRVERVKALLEYTKLRETKEIYLMESDKITLKEIVREIIKIVNRDICLERINKRFCRKCAYYDFCYAEE